MKNIQKSTKKWCILIIVNKKVKKNVAKTQKNLYKNVKM